MTRRLISRMAPVLALAVCFVACGDDAPTPTPPIPPNAEPSYVVIAQDDTVSYLVPVAELGDGATSDFTGVEVPGAAIGVSFGDDPYVYVGSNSGPDIIRYEVTSEGIVEDDRISLQTYGTTGTSGYQSNLLLVDKSKAYYIDNTNSQVVVWDPTEMVILDSVAHDSINEPGIRTGISGFPIFVDGKFFIGLGWLDAATLEVVHGAAVLVIDTADDSVTVVRDEAERCGYSFTVVEGEDGLYVGTEAYGAAQNALSDLTAAPCMLRLDPETLVFDGEYMVTFPLLLDGFPAGTLVPGPTPERAYLRVLDEEALGMTLDEWRTGGVGGTPVGNARVLSSRAAWLWVDLILGDEPLVSYLEHPPSSGATLRIDTGAETLIPEFDNVDGRTELRDFSGNVYGDIVLDAQGHVRSVVRVVPAR